MFFSRTSCTSCTTAATPPPFAPDSATPPTLGRCRRVSASACSALFACSDHDWDSIGCAHQFSMTGSRLKFGNMACAQVIESCLKGAPNRTKHLSAILEVDIPIHNFMKYFITNQSITFCKNFGYFSRKQANSCLLGGSFGRCPGTLRRGTCCGSRLSRARCLLVGCLLCQSCLLLDSLQLLPSHL